MSQNATHIGTRWSSGSPAAAGARHTRAACTVARLASLRLTLAILLLLLAGVLYAYLQPGRSTWPLVLPLALLALNLSAAVATNTVFRRQTALLVFHLSLIAIVLLVAAGRLTYLRGHVELSEGEWFAGQLTETGSDGDANQVTLHLIHS